MINCKDTVINRIIEIEKKRRKMKLLTLILGSLMFCGKAIKMEAVTDVVVNHKHNHKHESI